jgi:hypothetical protein
MHGKYDVRLVAQYLLSSQNTIVIRRSGSKLKLFVG